MPPRLLRSAIALALLPWHLAPAAFGQEHRHVPDHDHPNSIVHRHFEAHSTVRSDPADDHGRLAVDDDHVEWLDEAVLAQSEYRLTALQPIASPVTVLPSPARDVRVRVDFYSAPPHGPPRPSSSLRGPPYLSA